MPTTSGDASDVPEFTAALSEHSDEEMDELQFGNVDLTSNADAELVADSKAAVAVKHPTSVLTVV